MPLRLRLDGVELAFLSTKTTFAAPLDVTLAELSIESFFPADHETAVLMRRRLDELAPAPVGSGSA